MLPDIKTLELINIGPIHLTPFGPLVAIGILLGRALTLHRAKQAGIPRDEMDDAILYTLLSAFVLAHLVEAVFYHPEQVARQGIIYLLKFWNGISSFGGFFGGIFGFVFFVSKKENPISVALCRVYPAGIDTGMDFWATGMHDHLRPSR